MHCLHIFNCRIERKEAPLTDVMVCGGRVVSIGKNLVAPSPDIEPLDAGGQVLLPGLAGVRSHLTVPTPGDASWDPTLRAILGMGMTTMVVPVMLPQLQEDYRMLAKQEIPVVNYSGHVLLSSLRDKDETDMLCYSIAYGIPTAYYRMLAAGIGNRDPLKQEVATARRLGLRIVVDVDSEGSTTNHLDALKHLADIFQTDPQNDIFFVGVRYHEEFEIIKKIRTHCKVRAAIAPNLFNENNSHMHEISVHDQVALLGEHEWCSAGMLEVAALREIRMSSDTSGATLSSLTLLPVPLEDAYTYAGKRNMEFAGIDKRHTQVAVNSAANFILVNPEPKATLQVSNAFGATSSVGVTGGITAVVINGHVVKMGEELRTNMIHGENIYRHINH